MMRLRYMGSGGGGNSSSSTSNLSALAPPFTAHRLNPRPDSGKSLFHYTESPYAVESPTNWQFGIPSVPVPELGIDSNGIASVPLSHDYRFSAPASVSPSSHWDTASPVAETSGVFAYVDEVKSYHCPYVPPLVGEGSPLTADGTGCNFVPTSGLSLSSQVNHTQGLIDLKYGPQWDGILRPDDGKRAKGVDFGTRFSSTKSTFGVSDYSYQLNQGGHGIQFGRKSGQDSSFMYGTFNQLSEREANSISMENVEDKSCHEQNFGFLPFESNKTCVSGSSSTYPQSHSTILSREMNQSFLNYWNSCSPYEKCVRPVDSPFTNHVSVIRSSPTVVIRPPSSTNGNSEKNIIYGKKLSNGDVAGVHRVDSYHSSSSKRKDPGLNSSFEIKENSYENIFGLPNKQGCDQILVSSTSVKEPASCGLHSKDTSDRKARIGSQSPDINDSGGFGMASGSGQVVTSADGSSDFIDHHNTAVDSPCWKGAPSSQFSLFDIEAGNSNHVKINLDEHYVFDHDEHNNLHSLACSVGAFSGKKSGEGNKSDENGWAINGATFKLQSNLNTICPHREESSLDDAKSRDRFSTMSSSKGVQISDDPNITRKESGLLDNLEGGMGMKISSINHFAGADGAVMIFNDVSEGGAVAVHAAENVLNSPSSQEDAAGPTKLSYHKLNVTTMIKAMHNLSELMLCHLSDYAYDLEEGNSETLKYIISNLKSCMSKELIQSSNERGPDNSIGDTSEKLLESNCMGNFSGSPDKTHETSNSCTQFDYQHTQEDNINCRVPGKKDEKSPVLSSSRDELDMNEDDDMTKAIKRVLEDNFHYNEEMHAQSLLFKNLWLEAEAKLCSISYKARFDRMKIQMGKMQPQSPLVDGFAEMISQVRITPDPNASSEQASKAHDGTISKPTVQDASSTRTSRHGDDMEASIMARFSILKSQEENLKHVNKEEEQPHEMVDGELVDPIMARYGILKSREVNLKSNNIEEDQQPEKADGESGWYLEQCIRGQSEKPSNVALELRFPTQGSLSEGKCDFYEDNFGYESLKEHLPATKYVMTHLFDSSRMTTDKHCSGLRDSCSSDWEHVMKDDVGWRNS